MSWRQVDCKLFSRITSIQVSCADDLHRSYQQFIQYHFLVTGAESWHDGYAGGRGAEGIRCSRAMEYGLIET